MSYIYRNFVVIKPQEMRTDVSKATQMALNKRFHVSFKRWLLGTGGGEFISKFTGADAATFRSYIERYWLEDMKWYNYGSLWVIDHIVPLRLFDMTNDKDMTIAWNYQNTIPLYMYDNLHKGGSLHFSHQILSRRPQSDVNTALITIAEHEIKLLDRYLIH